MNYQKQYELLIEKHGSLDKPSGYSERHHIIPKSMGGSDDDSNLAYLSAKAHYVAHYLLWKIHGIGPMATAFWMMSSMNKNGKRCDHYTPSGRSFEAAKNAMVASMLGKPRAAEVRLKISKSKTGKPSKPHSQGSKDKISASKSFSADIFDYNTGCLVASGVSLPVWAKENNVARSGLTRTTTGERKHSGGYYAKYR